MKVTASIEMVIQAMIGFPKNIKFNILVIIIVKVHLFFNLNIF